MPISPTILLIVVIIDIVFWFTAVPMSRHIKGLFILTRFYFLLFYFLISFNVVNESVAIITLGRFATFFLFLSEIMCIIAIKLGDHNVPK